ncbi:STAS domain-containing protein [Amantichitinum ursilacus]|uniref:STAS domain protein n=1 Tax=Amantichitinum ursilacus TaxID=857265 RepID=A0A0N0GKX9_9NEIS|nr:STAS domain-containing protein [Amantichitinum ursilacus]KPC49534.1 STAS domain protein [Amantichitinum ursilacus]
METALTLNGDIARLTLSRHFTSDALQDFNRKALEALAHPDLNELHVDFENVQYMDTAAVAQLKRLNVRAKGRPVSLLGCTPQVQAVLNAAKCNSLFEICAIAP